MGREPELTQLCEHLAKAVAGERQVIFVTGEPGMGKTALLDVFLAGIGQWAKGNGAQAYNDPVSLMPDACFSMPSPWIARGYCVESYGAGEAYLPVLAALDSLSRAVGKEQLLPFLQQHAPSWLAQLPSLLPPAEREALQRQLTQSTTRRMLRELANFLAALTSVQPLVLVLEDLHWSDPSTVTLLSYLARWQERLRLLVLGSYRSAEVVRQKHPLAAVQGELAGQGLCTEVALPFLSEVAVVEYLQQRAPDKEDLGPLASTLYRQTAGLPLFMVAIVDGWLAQGQEAERNDNGGIQRSAATFNGQAPERLRQLVSVQMEQLPSREQRVLEAASVAGFEFSTAEVAAALAADEVTMEEQCEQLAQRQQFLRPAGVSEWPDGTVAARYGFRHAVYQSLWQERVKAGRWKRYHQLIGERKEAAYGERAREIAAELALHFEQGRDYRRAVKYYHAAGDSACRCSGNIEASVYLSKGLTLLQRLPATQERAQQELALQLRLAAPVGSTKGEGSSELEQIYTRAFTLSQQVGATSQLFPIALGLWLIPFTRGRLNEARARAEQLLRLAQEVDTATLSIWGHDMLGLTLCYCGEFPLALSYLQQTLTLYDPEQYRAHAFETGQDPGMTALFYMSGVLWWLGYPDQALYRVQEALTLAREMSRPLSVVGASLWAGELHVLRGEIALAQERAETAIAYATQRGFTEMLAWGTALRGWTFIEQGKVAEGQALLLQGRTAMESTGTKLGLPIFLAALAQISARQGQVEEGIQMLARGLKVAQRTGERRHEAELYRLKGELLLAQEDSKLKAVGQREKIKEAEVCFLKAIEVAQRQQAKSWELRATMSLARLWQQQNKGAEAHKMLSEVYNWFTEGFETKDLREAKALLDEL